ncbi:MAG: hypothetical protein R2774_02195 [Saprospiraceae bacterium]
MIVSLWTMSLAVQPSAPILCYGKKLVQFTKKEGFRAEGISDSKTNVNFGEKVNAPYFYVSDSPILQKIQSIFSVKILRVSELWNEISVFSTLLNRLVLFPFHSFW